MKSSNWLQKLLFKQSIKNKKTIKARVKDNTWIKCPKCNELLFISELKETLNICIKCNYHLKINARDRINSLLDSDKRVEIDKNLKSIDILNFKDTKGYKDRIISAQISTSENEALISMYGSINKLPVIICVFEFKFIGGSMGSVVGEKFVKSINLCLRYKVPLVCFSSSGGARMQESLISLMQMSKTAAAIGKLSDAKLPYISILTNPCMGGVSASIAMLGDINIAEPNALIGFAGPRVIEQTIKNPLPKDFQKSEFLLKKGTIDLIVNRTDMKRKIFNILKILMKIKQ